MGWFSKKDVVNGARVLTCSLDAGFTDLVTTDSEIYKRYYPATRATHFSGIQDLLGALGQQVDIVHLLTNASSEGMITDSEGNRIAGTDLIQQCCDHNIKFLWIASDNRPEAYINGFKANGKRINLVMTIDRKGAKFPEFLDRLLFRMANGDTLPVAWVDLCPQIPGAAHSHAPDCIFYAGRGGVKLL